MHNITISKVFCNSGYPGDRRGTQWIVEHLHVNRLWKGRHLLYREATSKGMSGSPVYFMDGNGEKAFVVAVHVGGFARLTNYAVPISQHMTPYQTWGQTLPSIGKLQLYFNTCLPIIIKLQSEVKIQK